MTPGSVIVLLLLFAMLHDGLTITGFEEVEKALLMKLGLSQRPIVNKNIKIPSATLDLYKSMQIENTITTNLPLPGLHTKSANTARTYSNKGSAPMNSKSQRYRLQFDVDPLPERERVKAAEVRFKIIFDKKLQNDEIVHILIHDIIKPGTIGQSEPILRLMDSRSIQISNVLKSKIISFDVTPAIERLSEENFTENHGMLVQCVTGSGSQTHLLDVFDFESSEKPLLMVYTDDGTNQISSFAEMMKRNRNKRSTDYGDGGAMAEHKKSKKKICQRYSLYVDFKEVGFNDWIVAPQGYEAYYCHGLCTFPLANHLNATNHAVMQTLMNSVNPRAVSKACCVPTKLRPETFLYVDDEEKVVVKNYSDMTVEECGCR